MENNKIVYKWFRKEMSNYLLLLANSAMPDRTKRECLVQYAMTILLNTSRQLPWEVAADTLSEFSHRMLVSGYHAKFRLEVIKAAVMGTSARWPGPRAEVRLCTGPGTTSLRRGGRRS